MQSVIPLMLCGIVLKNKDIMLEGMDKFIPKACFNKNRKAKHVFPFSKSLQTLIRKKHRSWNRWMETRDGKNIENM